MNNFNISQDDQEIIDRLIADFELQPELIQQILYLVTKKYAALEAYGAKTNLKSEIAHLIEIAAGNKNPGSSNQDDYAL